MRKNLRWLYTFCTVARVLNYKRAAEELFLTPSAISHQMSELELQLGAKLFQRTTRSMVLTSKGLKLYQKVLPHLQAIDLATQEVSGPKAKQHLHVQLPEFFASELLMPAIPEFASNNKNIELQIEGADINENKNPKADVTILLNQNKPKAKITTPSTAAIKALKKLNIKKISIFTPYSKKLNDEVIDYFSSKGFDIVANTYLDIAADYDIGKVDQNFLFKTLSQIEIKNADALFISCTALPVLNIIERLEKELGKPVITSNQSLIWDTLESIGMNKDILGFGKLFNLDQ